jgi:uncharacterized protein (DUF305 family)
MTLRTLFVAAAFAALPALAFAQDGMAKMDRSGAHSGADKAYMQSMQDMHEKMMGMKPTGDADVDFVMMMKPHHEAAVEMAKAYLKYGSDPVLTRMAKDIISSQDKEIQEMDAWMKTHGK